MSGEVIQRASERALAAGMTFAGVLDIVREFRTRDQETPVVLMGYLNPLEAAGYSAAAERAAAAGVDGILTVDLPPEEAEEFVREVRAQGIDPVFLVSPTSSDERIARICEEASGFVYYVSLKGVTGAATLDADEVAVRMARIRRATELPVGVGFGIHDGASAARIARVSDAVVVGSAVVSRVEVNADSPDALPDILAAFIAVTVYVLWKRKAAALSCTQRSPVRSAGTSKPRRCRPMPANGSMIARGAALC